MAVSALHHIASFFFNEIIIYALGGRYEEVLEIMMTLDVVLRVSSNMFEEIVHMIDYRF